MPGEIIEMGPLGRSTSPAPSVDIPQTHDTEPAPSQPDAADTVESGASDGPPTPTSNWASKHLAPVLETFAAGAFLGSSLTHGTPGGIVGAFSGLAWAGAGAAGVFYNKQGNKANYAASAASTVAGITQIAAAVQTIFGANPIGTGSASAVAWGVGGLVTMGHAVRQLSTGTGSIAGNTAALISGAMNVGAAAVGGLATASIGTRATGVISGGVWVGGSVVQHASTFATTRHSNAVLDNVEASRPPEFRA